VLLGLIREDFDDNQGEQSLPADGDDAAAEG